MQVQHLVTSKHVKLVFKDSNSPYKFYVLHLISVNGVRGGSRTTTALDPPLGVLCEAASF